MPEQLKTDHNGRFRYWLIKDLPPIINIDGSTSGEAT
jgi:hypothetical protein